jgi:hypothetical protein
MRRHKRQRCCPNRLIQSRHASRYNFPLVTRGSVETTRPSVRNLRRKFWRFAHRKRASRIISRIRARSQTTGASLCPKWSRLRKTNIPLILSLGAIIRLICNILLRHNSQGSWKCWNGYKANQGRMRKTLKTKLERLICQQTQCP